jgi:hypothetical protein
VSLIKLLLGERLDSLFGFNSLFEQGVVFAVVLLGFFSKDFHFGLFFKSMSNAQHFQELP